jgi:hypothetical protein
MNDKTSPAETGPPMKRKKSQKRQRTKETKTRWLDDEFNTAAANAKASGLPLSAFMRALATARPGAGAAHASLIDEGLAKQFLAACGRHGNNWNQIAYKLNVGAAPFKLQEDVERELDNLREVIALGLAALGKKPHRA